MLNIKEDLLGASGSHIAAAAEDELISAMESMHSAEMAYVDESTKFTLLSNAYEALEFRLDTVDEMVSKGFEDGTEEVIASDVAVATSVGLTLGLESADISELTNGFESGGIKELFTKIWNAIKSAANKVWEFLKELVDKVITFVKGIFGSSKATSEQLKEISDKIGKGKVKDGDSGQLTESEKKTISKSLSGAIIIGGDAKPASITTYLGEQLKFIKADSIDKDIKDYEKASKKALEDIDAYIKSPGSWGGSKKVLNAIKVYLDGMVLNGVIKYKKDTSEDKQGYAYFESSVTLGGIGQVGCHETVIAEEDKVVIKIHSYNLVPAEHVLKSNEKNVELLTSRDIEKLSETYKKLEDEASKYLSGIEKATKEMEKARKETENKIDTLISDADKEGSKAKPADIKKIKSAIKAATSSVNEIENKLIKELTAGGVKTLKDISSSPIVGYARTCASKYNAEKKD